MSAVAMSEPVVSQAASQDRSRQDASRTPADVPIAPRHPQFELDDCIARDWHGGDPFRTAFFNALSLTFPKGEKFFIDSIRAFQGQVSDPKLTREIRGFIGQEAIHSREHQRMNDALARVRGYPVSRIDARLDRDTAWANENLAPLTRLAFTAATEHITAILGHALLTDPRWLDGADPRMAVLWRWHAAEEIEHKSVAFDTYLAVGGSRKVLRRGLKLETWSLINHVGAGMYLMLRADGLHLKPRVWIDGIKWLFGRDGILRSAVPSWRAFLRDDFHPWAIDDRELIERGALGLAGAGERTPAMSTLTQHLIVSALAVALVFVVVAMHYEALRLLGRTLGAHVHKRIGVLLVMIGLLVAHALEIWVFAFGFKIVDQMPDMGHIYGVASPDAFDYMYLSSMVYSTVGFGDYVPVGAMRMLAAAEALTGFSLITWSASFTFLAMQRFWPAPLSEDEEEEQRARRLSTRHRKR